MRIHHFVLLGVVLSCYLAAAPSFAEETLLLDEGFDDTRPLVNSSADPYWRTHGRVGETVQEHDGRLMLRASGADYANTHLYSPPQPDFNFLRRPVSLIVHGLSITGEGGLPMNQSTRFSFVSEATTEYYARSSVTLYLAADGTVRLGYKVNAPNRDPSNSHILYQKKLSAVPSNFTLQLDGAGYKLSMLLSEPSGGERQIVAEGRFAEKGPGLSMKEWGADTASLVLMAQKAKGQSSDSATVRIDHISVLSAAN